MSAAALRCVARARLPPSMSFRPAVVARRQALRLSLPRAAAFSTTVRRPAHDPHEEETFEEFTARYEKEFEGVNDVFELQRNLNNAFAYDLVPSPAVVSAALRAARRVNDFPTAVRVFEAIRAKVENKSQYDEYLKELEPIREELGVTLRDNLYPEYAGKNW